MFTQIIPPAMFKDVQDFMRIMDTNRDFVWWAETLITEETKELSQAMSESEGMAQVFKESADLFYVVAGFYNCMPHAAPMLLSEERNEAIQTIVEDAWNTLATASNQYKIPMELFGKAFAIVHASNLSKLDDEGNPIRREDGKIMKGPNYVAPDMTPVVNAWDELMAAVDAAEQENTDAETSD